jgi:putative copper export protein
VTEILLPPLQRGLLFVGALGLGGLWVWRTLIAPEAARALGEGGAAMMGGAETRVLRLGGWIALFLLGVWALRVPVQLMGFRDPFAPLSEDLAFLLFETFWGSVWMAQGVILMALIPLFWVGVGAGARARATVLTARTVAARVPWGDPTPPPPLPWRWRLLGTGIGGVILTMALSSHAMSVPSNRPLAVALDGLHTLAAGGWLGALALILWGGSGAERDDGLAPHRNRLAAAQAAQFTAFSPVAMVSVGTLMFTGFLLATQHVIAWEHLWGSPYGRVLLLKVGVVAGVLAIGAWNWRRGLPGMDSEEGRRALVRRARLEVLLALVVLAVTAVLTGMPMPEGTHLM